MVASKSNAPARKRQSRSTGPSALGWFARGLALAALLWIGGFVLFIFSLPGPAAPGTVTEGVVVLTGGPGRLDRGAEVLKAGLAERLLVSGVHPSVKPAELAKAAGIPEKLASCKVDLGFKADSTRTNAIEVSDWVARNRFKSIRLVTAAYHMPRAHAELAARLPADVQVVNDGVKAGLPLWSMLVEYTKFQASWLLLRVRPV
ncbi:YdcF family protein [Sandaracinobacter neustonicus]|uniref:YdcF family protein n=1 Tax=Sandaracinobacter neustonicus TaxID=1715348 RepID=A0A501XDF0_9SPHN|nr:YdcF family protein [Sandaracinobacter neustonicus]TPE58601.1 YdcF family protein [Sandaracinobacter neustonicus]